MLNSRCWPHLAALLKYDTATYIVSPLRLVEEQCASGEYSLVGQGLFSARLDMALAGLMAELGDDFFYTNVFPSRLTAAVDIFTAARVFLQCAQPGGQANRVRLLAEEIQEVLRHWAGASTQENGQNLLIAAEEAAILT